MKSSIFSRVIKFSPSSPFTRAMRFSAVASVVLLGATVPASALNSTWNVDASGSWSTPGNWSNGIPTSAGDVANLTFNITTANRTVTIDTTPRTVGILNIGDPDNTNIYTVAASGGATLTLDNNGGGAQINEVANSRGATISAPLIMSDALTLTNSSTSALTISGGITSTGTQNLTINANNTGAVSLSTAVINNAGTITNSGSGAGTTTIASVGSNVTAITESSTTSALTITTLNVNGAGTTLTNALGTKVLTASTVTGSGNLILNNNSALASGIVVTTVSSTGSITNSGSGSGKVGLTGALGSNVTDVIQNSATSLLELSGSNTISGSLYVKSGTVNFTGGAGVVQQGGLNTIQLGDNVVGLDAAITFNNTNVYPTGINVVSGSGARILANSGGAPTVAGAITLNNNLTLSGRLNITGGVTGTGNVTINSSTTTGSTVSGTAINNVGTITNSGTNTGTTVISSVIGSNVTGLIQNSTSSALTISGSNSFAGDTLVSAGLLTVSNTYALQNSAIDTSGAGTITLTGVTAPTIGGLKGSKDITSVITSGYNGVTTLTINSGSGAANSYSGAIVSGTVATALIKTGQGTQKLSNSANTYSGGTQINAGTLLVNNASGNALGTGNVTVGSGGTLGGTGFVALSGANTVTISGAIAPGDGGIESLNIANDVTWNGGVAWKFELGSGTASDQLLITGVGSDLLKGTGSTWRFDFQNTGVGGTTYTLIDWDGTTSFSATDFSYTGLAIGVTGTFVLNGSQLDFVTVPEPSTYVLLGMGLLVIGVVYRRQVRSL